MVAAAALAMLGRDPLFGGSLNTSLGSLESGDFAAHADTSASCTRAEWRMNKVDFLALDLPNSSQANVLSPCSGLFPLL